MVFVYHATWCVNSATHFFGYRNYEIDDLSRNTWWVALITFGEGWHNNHHAYQQVAEAGHKWWEVDVTMMVIRLLNAMGLVTKLKSIKDIKFEESQMIERLPLEA
jgi:stearoyl-CoA desaturase (delta-9 desaturase)